MFAFFESWVKQLFGFHTAKAWVPRNMTHFFAVAVIEIFCRADISAQTNFLAILLCEYVKEHVFHTSLAVSFPSATEATSYEGMAFWREVPVFVTYRCDGKEDGKSDSA